MQLDKLEKAGRLVLWLALSGSLVFVPLKWAKQDQNEAALRKTIEELTAQLKDRENPKVERLAIASLGVVMRALNVNKAEGSAWFTNVSSRKGVVCLVGTATNSQTALASASLPSCSVVEPYAAVRIDMIFAGGQLSTVCPDNSSCSMKVEDAPEVTAPVGL